MTVFAPWTDEEIEQLKTLWGIGETGSRIARALGKSRNSVMSKVHRMKLTRNTGYGVDRAVRKPNVNGRVAQQRPRRAATMPPVRGASAENGQTHVTNLPTIMQRPVVSRRKRSRLPDYYDDDKVFKKLVDELQPPIESIYNIPNTFQCKWITGDVKDGDAVWCRKPAVCGKSWCKKHLELAYQPPRPRELRRRYR